MSNKVSVGIEVPVTISVGDKKLTVSYEEGKAVFEKLKTIYESSVPNVVYPGLQKIWCSTSTNGFDTSVQNSITDRQNPIQ